MTIARAIFRAVRVPGLTAPHDTAHIRITYPARLTNSEFERNTGVVEADGSLGPCPVAILFPGINVAPEGVGWLARDLAASGIVVVTYTLIGEEMPGFVSLTPGIDLAALAPGGVGTRPSALALAPILEDLRACNDAGVLSGVLDLDRIALGGHSAGGTVALLNANPDWFPGVRGAFSYAAHTAGSTALGHPPGTMLPIHPGIPVLIMGGDNDGVIAESAHRYGDPPGDTTQRVVATFDEAVTRNAGDSVLAIVRGANHFTLVDPPDPSTGRPFIDRPDTSRNARALIGAFVSSFLHATLRRTPPSRQVHLAPDHALTVHRVR